MISKDIREYIIRPTLQVVDMWSDAAEVLVYGTGMVESGFNAIRQTTGPALGFYQCEPATYKDLGQYIRINFAKGLLDKILSACYYECMPVDPAELMSNIKFATLICRIHYWRVRAKLPNANDANGLASYHKMYYNSAKGKADVERNTEIFQRIINGEL